MIAARRGAAGGAGRGRQRRGGFTRASDALAAALDVQRAVQPRLAGGASLKLRIALHTAEAQLRDEGNYFGQAVNRCARLRAVAHGGQVVLSRTDARPGPRPAARRRRAGDLGVHRLRDLGRPEHVFGLAAPGAARRVPAAALAGLDAQQPAR